MSPVWYRQTLAFSAFDNACGCDINVTLIIILLYIILVQKCMCMCRSIRVITLMTQSIGGDEFNGKLEVREEKESRRAGNGRKKGSGRGVG